MYIYVEIVRLSAAPGKYVHQYDQDMKFCAVHIWTNQNGVGVAIATMSIYLGHCYCLIAELIDLFN